MKHKIFLIVLVGILISGCSPSGPGGAPAMENTVVIGVLSDLQSWNPYLADDLFSEEISNMIYPSLGVEQADFHMHPPTFEPTLAKSWEWSADHLTLTVHLRADAMWSDGVPVTSEDLVFSFHTQNAPEVAWAWMNITHAIEKIEAIDAHTVRYQFTRNYPYQFMDINDGPIVPAHLWKEIPYENWVETDWSEMVLSAGPFLKGAHTPQQEIILEQNPDYYVADQPRLKRLVFRVVPSKTTLLTQLRSGGIDFLNFVPPAEAERVRTDPNLELVVYSDRSYTHILWNLRRSLFADPKIRRALSMAINRNNLIDVVYEGYAQPSVGPVLSSMWAFNRDLEPIPYDPASARKILAEAGWEDSDGNGFLQRDGREFEFEIIAPSENEIRQDICLMVERDLAQIGVRVIPRFIEWGAMQAAMENGTFDALVNRWEEPTQVDLGEIWHSSPPDAPTLNFGGYANPEVDRLIDQTSILADFADQKPLFDRIQELIVADQPYTFLVENVRLTGLNSRIKGTDINASTPYFNIAEWRVEN